MKILAVDDEPHILELLKTSLKTIPGCDVSLSDSGINALSQIDEAKVPFDCLLIDIQMPRMNGITLCELVRSIPEYQHTPILMLTAMSQRKYIDRSFLAGATDYIPKPFDLAELRSRLAQARQLANERRASGYQRVKTIEASESASPDDKPRYDTAAPVDKRDRVLGAAEFENYILQMSQRKLFNSSVVAIKLVDAKKLRKRLNDNDFRSVLTAIASAISELSANKPGGIICYRGDGIFLYAIHGFKNFAPGNLESRLNQTLSLTGLPERLGVNISVIAGEFVTMRAIARSKALLAVQRAVEMVEDRAMETAAAPAVPKRMFRDHSQTPEMARLERRNYELILQDILKEEDRLKWI